jgi:hypothetical protein
MKSKMFLLLIFFAVIIYAETDIKEWEKHGVTSKEWAIAKKHNIDIEKLDDLTSIGITIQEYLKKPWVINGLDESTWLKLRRLGWDEGKIAKDCIKYRKKKRFFHCGGIKSLFSSEK